MVVIWLEQLIVLIILYSMKRSACVSVKNEYPPNLAANQKQNQTKKKENQTLSTYEIFDASKPYFRCNEIEYQTRQQEPNKMVI